jgi:molybdenum cofactor synthesis domain-containing protein
MVRAAVVTVSSTIAGGAGPDEARPALERLIGELPGTLVAYGAVADDRKAIREHLVALCETHDPDVVFTLGGTGVRPTDWTPEATRDVIEKDVPGLADAMRQASLKKVMTAALSRGIAGIRGRTLIVNLPGSVKGAQENFAVIAPILEHAVSKIRK